jgi:hypothetical protein
MAPSEGNSIGYVDRDVKARVSQMRVFVFAALP